MKLKPLCNQTHFQMFQVFLEFAREQDDERTGAGDGFDSK